MTLLNVKLFTKCKSFIINLTYFGDDGNDNNDNDYELFCGTPDRRNRINPFLPNAPFL